MTETITSDPHVGIPVAEKSERNISVMRILATYEKWWFLASYKPISNAVAGPNITVPTYSTYNEFWNTVTYLTIWIVKKKKKKKKNDRNCVLKMWLKSTSVSDCNKLCCAWVLACIIRSIVVPYHWTHLDHGCVSYTPLPPLDWACSCQHNVNRADCLVSAD